MIAPTLSAIEVGGAPSDTAGGGDRLALLGASFVSGAAVLANGVTMPARLVSAARIEVALPTLVGDDPGGAEEFVVQNPDGSRSNPVRITRLPRLDSGFRADPNGWPFDNFTHGQGVDWGCYQSTFGTTEVDVSVVTDPVLTGGYYMF